MQYICQCATCADFEEKMTKAARENRIPIMMSNEELEAIDDWRFNTRVATRSDAIRRLCKIALLIEEHFDDVVDTGLESFNNSTKILDEMREIERPIYDENNQDLLFGIKEVQSLLNRLESGLYDVCDDISQVYIRLLELFNAIVLVAETPNLGKAFLELKEKIQKLDKKIEETNRRKESSRENIYISIIYDNETEDQKKYYNSLDDNEQEEYLKERFKQLAHEEQENPKKFAEKYYNYFWRHDDWVDSLRKKYLEFKKPSPNDNLKTN